MEREMRELKKKAWPTLVGGALGAAWLVALGCGIFEPVIQPTTQCAGYAEFGYWYKNEPNQFSLCVDGSVPVTVEFKGADGQPVPGGGGIDAPGWATYPWPADAVSADWYRPEDEDRGGEELLTVLPFAGSMGAAVPAGWLPAGAKEYVFGCSTLKVKPTDVARSYEYGVLASSLAQAQALVSPLIYHGVGGNLPPGVTVHYDIEAELVGLALEIRSSLHGRFDHFHVDINGQPVADLGTGLNVQVTHPGSRWMTVTATIPLSQLSEQMDLTLVQQAEGDPSEFQLTTAF